MFLRDLPTADRRQIGAFNKSRRSKAFSPMQRQLQTMLELFRSNGELVVIGIFLITLICARLIGISWRPVAEQFNCSRCGRLSYHNARTIRASKTGTRKFFCPSCHKRWLDSKPTVSRYNSSRGYNGNSGCLSVIIVVVCTLFYLLK